LCVEELTIFPVDVLDVIREPLLREPH
jgi:hypothetical protein